MVRAAPPLNVLLGWAGTGWQGRAVRCSATGAVELNRGRETTYVHYNEVQTTTYPNAATALHNPHTAARRRSLLPQLHWVYQQSLQTSIKQ